MICRFLGTSLYSLLLHDCHNWIIERFRSTYAELWGPKDTFGGLGQKKIWKLGVWRQEMKKRRLARSDQATWARSSCRILTELVLLRVWSGASCPVVCRWSGPIKRVSLMPSGAGFSIAKRNLRQKCSAWSHQVDLARSGDDPYFPILIFWGLFYFSYLF